MTIQELKPCVKYGITVGAKIFIETTRTTESDLKVQTEVTVISNGIVGFNFIKINNKLNFTISF